MTIRIPKRNKQKSEDVVLIGIEKEEVEKEEEEKNLDPKALKERAELKKLKKRLTFHIVVLFIYKFFALSIYIFLTFKTFTISDVEFLNKLKKINFILKLDIFNFLFIEMFIIFFIHLINLVILHKFFQKAIENKSKIQKFGEDSIVKRFTEFLEKNDTFKFFVYLLNVFLPLLIMVYIFFKSGKFHNITFYFINSFIIAITTLAIVIFLYRNIETFDFGKKLDILIWAFLYIVFSIFILHAYFIYFSLKFDIRNKITYIAFIVLFVISIILLIFMKLILKKYPSILNLGAIFLPTIVLFFSILAIVVNLIFVVFDNKPKNIRVLSYLIPKIEIYGDEFNKIYSENRIEIDKRNLESNVYISFKNLDEDDKLNVSLKNLAKYVFPEGNINYTEDKKTLDILNKISALLSFKDENLKFDKLVNIYAELSTFYKSKLDFTHLEYSIFNYSTFIDTSIRNAVLKGIDLRYSIIKDVDFSNSDLSGADFSFSILINPKFSNTNLKSANFSYAVLINPVFVENNREVASIEESNWENAIIIFPKICEKFESKNNKNLDKKSKNYITKEKTDTKNTEIVCLDFKRTRNIESALVILNTKNIDKKYLIRFSYLNSLSDWYKKLKRILKNDKKNKENKLTAIYFLYVLNLLKDNPQTKRLIDAPYNRSINYSTKIIFNNFKIFLIRKNIIKASSEKKGLSSIFDIKKFSLNEKQRRGVIVLLTVITMATAMCFFCRKAKL